MTTRSEATTAACPLDRLVMWLGLKKPDFQNKPQPCPHCGVETVRGWVEGGGDNERFYIEHGDPVCFAGSKRTEVFLLSRRDIECFRYWTHNEQSSGRAP